MNIQVLWFKNGYSKIFDPPLFWLIALLKSELSNVFPLPGAIDGNIELFLPSGFLFLSNLLPYLDYLDEGFVRSTGWLWPSAFAPWAFSYYSLEFLREIKCYLFLSPRILLKLLFNSPVIALPLLVWTIVLNLLWLFAVCD